MLDLDFRPSRRRVLPRAPLLELRGPKDSLDWLTTRLTGRLRRPGHPVRVRWGWWQSSSAHRALLLLESHALLPALVTDFSWQLPEVAVLDLSSTHVCIAVDRSFGRDPAGFDLPPVMSVPDGRQRRWLVVSAHLQNAARGRV